MSEPQQPPLPPYSSGDHGFPPAAPQPAHPPAYAPQPGYAQPGPAQPGPAQPGYAQPVYAQPGQPQPVYPAYGAQSAASPGNALGRIAFIVAAITFGIGLLGTLSIPFLYATIGYDPMIVGFATGGTNLITLIGFAAALILGIVALRRPAPHVLAAIAVGIAGSGVIGTVVAWISTFFYGFI